MGEVDLSAIATNLHLAEDGVWTAQQQSTVSYPEAGHSRVLAVEDRSFWFQHRNRCIAALLRRFPPSGTIFDVGGGNGAVSRALQRAGFEVALVEPLAEGIANARARGVRTLVRATIDDAGFRQETLPAVGLFDVIEHLPNDAEALSAMQRLLLPGGRLYVTVPAHQVLWSVDDERAGHHRRYSLKQLRDVLGRAGLVCEYSSFFFWPLPLPIALFRALPSRLRLRRQPPDPAAEHGAGGGLLARTLRLALSAEARWIEAGRHVMVGASCIAVARRAEP